MNKQLRQNARNFLVGLTIAEIQKVLDLAIAQSVRSGHTERVTFIKQYLDECISEFNVTGRCIKITYGITTPESVEFADHGWENEKGESIKIDCFEVAEFGDEHAAAVACAVDFLQESGRSLEVSDYPACCPGHTWYTESEGEMNYSDGSEKMLSFHLYGFTEDEEHAIYAEITGRKVSNDQSI